MRLIKIILIFLLFSTSVYASTEPCKSFDDYQKIRLSKHATHKKEYYIAKEKEVSTEPSLYYNEKWHLIKRESLHEAQIDKAATDIIQYFLFGADLGPEIHVVERSESDYFIARRGINHYTPWKDAYSSKDQMINKYTLDRMGILTKGKYTKKLVGFATAITLAEFVGIKDISKLNAFGVQETDTEFRVYKIDNTNAFDKKAPTNFKDAFETPDTELSKATLTYKLVYNMWFQWEKSKILMSIANTKFSVIENFVRANVDDNADEIVQQLKDRYNEIRKHNQLD